MKKTLIALMLCFVSIMSFGQVTIQKNQKTDEIVLSSGNGYIYHDKTTDEYYLGIASDNHFEDKLVIVKLGTGKEETIKSIQAIESTWESSKDGDTFEVIVLLTKVWCIIYGTLLVSSVLSLDYLIEP